MRSPDWDSMTATECREYLVACLQVHGGEMSGEDVFGLYEGSGFSRQQVIGDVWALKRQGRIRVVLPDNYYSLSLKARQPHVRVKLVTP